jgi:hypothetical protein
MQSVCVVDVRTRETCDFSAEAECAPCDRGQSRAPCTGVTGCLSVLNASLIGPVWEKNGVFQRCVRRYSCDITATESDILVGRP